MQGLGRRCTGSGTTADAGTSKKIRGQSAPRVGYSGSRVSRRQPGRRRHHEGCSRVDGYVSGVRATSPTGRREVVGTNHRMSEEVKAVSGVLIPMESSPAPAATLAPAGEKPAAKKEVNDFPFAVAVGDVYEAPPDAVQDPRNELVNRLLEHEKFKSAAQMLLQKQQIEDAIWSNPALKEFKDAEGTEPELVADVIDLVKTFQQILDRARSRPILQVDEETVTVGQMIDYLRRRLSLEEKPIRLKQMLRNIESRQALVCMFLAMLELVRLQAIQLRQDRLFGEILIRKHVGFEAVMNEQAAVRDDWK